MAPEPATPWALLQRGYPNANCVLLRGPRPVLVDTGHPGDVDSLLAWLGAEGVAPADLSLVVNTHFHSDHVGGNPMLQAMGVPIAASRLEAELVKPPRPGRLRWRLAEPNGASLSGRPGA